MAGIGFTVPLLIIGAALPAGPEATAATAGLLAGSLLSAGAGGVALRLRLRHPWLLAVGFDALIAGLDAALGREVVLAGLLGLGPLCAAVLSGRRAPTIAVACLSVALATALAAPDGTWGRPTGLSWIGVVAVVGLASVAIAHRLPSRRRAARTFP